MIMISVLAVPGKPSLVEVIDSSATAVNLTIEPPLNNGGVPVHGYRVEFEDRTLDFPIRKYCSCTGSGIKQGGGG